MKVIAGVNGSAQSHEAARAAALIASRSAGEAVLLHAGELAEDHSSADRCSVVAQVARQVAAAGAPVSALCQSEEEPAVALAKSVRELGADLVAVGTPSGKGWRFSPSPSVALAATLRLPLLAVRDAGCFASACEGEPLRVLLATDLTNDSAAAVSFTRLLAQFFPCKVTAAYSVHPIFERARHGMHGAVPLSEIEEELRVDLERDLERQIEPLSGLAEVDTFLDPNVGNVAAHLEQMARRFGATLVVVSSHQRNHRDFFHTSGTSRELVSHGDFNVCSVPVSWHHERAGDAAEVS